MWLLDANMDVPLLAVFSEFGIPCESAIHRGWQGLANGQLVSEAARAGFTCILTAIRTVEGMTHGLCAAGRMKTGICRGGHPAGLDEAMLPCHGFAAARHLW